MTEADILLRSTSFPPLTTKGSRLTWAELDANFTAIYESLFSQRVSSYVPDWYVDTLFDNDINNYAKYDGVIWKFINPTPTAGITPGTDPLSWEQAYAADLAHRKDRDTFLDYGGDNQVSAQELKEIVDPDRVIPYFIMSDNGSPQHKWKIMIDSTGEFYKEDLGEV